MMLRLKHFIVLLLAAVTFLGPLGAGLTMACVAQTEQTKASCHEEDDPAHQGCVCIFYLAPAGQGGWALAEGPTIAILAASSSPLLPMPISPPAARNDPPEPPPPR